MPLGVRFWSETRPLGTRGQIAPSTRERLRPAPCARAPTLTALEAVRIGLEMALPERVTTRICIVTKIDGMSKRKVPLLLAVRVSPSWLKPALKGQSWRSSATRVPPTAVPPTRPITDRLPLQTTRLGVSAIEMPVGSRAVTNERSRLRVVPAEFVATAR